ncbi:MAG: NeuD/PglB/VioB family sugar acetyltransferase [Clostridia bacterium]|nr:NeuD/PglB/VioB family sugar acetyltransferase [Clostridia bacterium]
MVLGVYGASGLGTEFVGLAERINEELSCWTEIVFVDDDEAKRGTTLVNLPILNFEEALAKYGTDGIEFILSIGEPVVKDIVFEKVCSRGCKVTNLFHPEFRMPNDIKIGQGLVVHRFSGLPPCSVFGNNILIQGHAIMGHNLTVGDNVVVSSLSFVGGDVKIGRNTYIAPGACVRNGVTIGENVVVGMGAIVTKDIPDNAVVYGNPAKIMRYNEKGRVFSK